MTSMRAVLTAGRAKVATIALSRDASKTWKEHTTNTPFAKSPLSTGDGFELVPIDDTFTQGFGVEQIEEGQFFMMLRLGHGPYSIDKERDNLVADDVKRLGDRLEAFTWPVGVMAVWYEGRTTNKENPNWWVTEMRFRVMYRSAVDA